MSPGLESHFTITCGECGHVSPALSWTERPITGDLPIGEFQCPQCNYAFRRQRVTGDAFRQVRGEWKHAPIELIPIAARL